MVCFEGRVEFVHQQQRKPTGNGIKIYAICESLTGYTYAFEIDQRNGKTIEQFVLDITGKLKPCYHKLFMDNLFTSVALLKQLLERSLYACGTVRQNCGLPNALTAKQSGITQPGTRKWMMAPPQLLADAWQDTGHTNMLPSMHHPNSCQG